MQRTLIGALIVLGFISSARAADALTSFPTWGVAFAAPAGKWKFVPSNHPPRFATWEWPGAPAGTRPASINIAASSVDKPLDYYVESWKKSYAANAREFAIDGERAFEIIDMKQKANASPAPDAIIVALRGKTLYTIMGFATPEGPSKADVAAICASWKWIERESTSKHLELAEPVVILEGAVRAALPVWAYQFVGVNDKYKLLVGLQNVETDKPDFTLEFESRTKVPELKFEELADACLTRLWYAFKADTKPEWKTLNGPTPRMISKPFVASTPDDFDDQGNVLRPAYKRVRMFGVVQLDQDRFIQISATLNSPNAEDHPLLAAMAEKMVESIVAVPPPAPAVLKMNPVKEFPTFGIACAAPGGNWETMLGIGGPRAALWRYPGATNWPGIAYLSIDAYTSTATGLDATADNWQKERKGDRREITLDGERALELTNLVEVKGSKPEIVVLAAHKNVIHVITGTASESHPTKPEVAAMCASWKWTEREPVAKHLDLGPPIPALAGKIQIAVPAIAFQSADDRTKFKIGLQNVTTNSADFSFGIELMTRKKDVDFEQFGDLFLEQVSKQYQTEPQPIWKILAGPTPRKITQPFFIIVPERKSPEGKTLPEARVVSMYGVVAFDDQKTMLITITLTSPTTTDNHLFAAMATKMVESIVIGEKK